MAPQILMLVLAFIGLLINANKHGKPKTGNDNFWIHSISVILTLSILYWGGFFDIFFK